MSNASVRKIAPFAYPAAVQETSVSVCRAALACRRRFGRCRPLRQNRTRQLKHRHGACPGLRVWATCVAIPSAYCDTWNGPTAKSDSLPQGKGQNLGRLARVPCRQKSRGGTAVRTSRKIANRDRRKDAAVTAFCRLFKLEKTIMLPARSQGATSSCPFIPGWKRQT